MSKHEDTAASEDVDELEQQLLLDMESDEEDANEALLEEMQLFDSRDPLVHSSLLKKLELSDGNFPISARSNYLDATWYLDRGEHAYSCNIHLDRKLEGSNELKRALIFHCIPENAPFGNIRSNSSSKAKGNEYTHLENYVFSQNKLFVTIDHIPIISTALLNEALDNARDSGLKSHYMALYTMLKLWANLSSHALIPEHLRLQVDFTKIDTVERRTDVLRPFKGRLQSWVAYSEEDLEILFDYALYWTEKVLPEIPRIRDLIAASPLNIAKNKYAIYAQRAYPNLDEELVVKIDGKIVFQVSHALQPNNGIIKHRYNWITQYGVMLDKIRNSLFILIALITGGRASELAPMKFSDVTQDANGEYWIAITRLKTAQDQNFSGKQDKLPLPTFIGDCIKTFQHIKNVGRFDKQPYLFQACQSTKVVQKVNAGLIEFVITQLKEDLPIDRLHAHRFRKTIAEILINRDERNIDIIRRLFGHASYAMTLQYIARNPTMVRSIAITIEQNFTKDLHEIVANIAYGHSGFAGARIAKQIQSRPHDFTGKQLKLSILVYITHLLKAGEPIYVRRTALGIYCITSEHYTESTLPPCIEKVWQPGDLIAPNPDNCQIDCKKIVVLNKAKQALKDNIVFYEALLDAQDGKVSSVAHREITRRIDATRDHLLNLEKTGRMPGTEDLIASSGHDARQLMEVIHE